MPARTDRLTPFIPPEGRIKLAVLRVEIVKAFMEGRHEDWGRYTREVALILRLAGILPAADIKHIGGVKSRRGRKPKSVTRGDV